jgi:zinc protease
MIELHWTEADGVAVVWAEAPGPLRAGLLFRAGRADETLATSGHTHLVEHMAFTSMADTLHRHNGMVDIATSGFFTVGDPGEVSAFLASVCHALASVPAERLEEEKRLLKAEAATRPHDVCGHLLVWRFGAAGYGMAGMAELGLHRATIDQLREFSAQRFTSGNAILWLTGPPPAGLRLRLPPGAKRPLPPVAPIQSGYPGCFADDRCGGVAAGAVVPRSCASNLFADIALARLRRQLRVQLAMSYAPAVFYVPLNAEAAHLVLYADADESRRLDLARAFGEIVPRLAEVQDAEVADARARIREHWTGALAPPLEERIAGELYRVAMDWLYARDFEPREALETELAAAATEDVAAVGRQAHSSVIYALPGKAPLEPWCGKPIPVSTMPVVKGRETACLDAPVRQERLRYGPEGVSLVWPDGSHCSVHFKHLALALHHEDGCVMLIGHDAATLAIEPTLWRNGHEICGRIRQWVPGELLVEQPPRNESEIPKPSTTTWQRFLAHLGLDEEPGGPVARAAAPAECPSCGAKVIEGSVHCIKCGHLLVEPAQDPGDWKTLFRWWLMLYGFWRISSILRNGVAALHSLPGSENQLFAAGLSVLSALSLIAIGMLLLERRRGLLLFVGAELAVCFWLLGFGDHAYFVFPQIAIVIMLILGKGAKYRVV